MPDFSDRLDWVQRNLPRRDEGLMMIRRQRLGVPGRGARCVGESERIARRACSHRSARLATSLNATRRRTS
jgi:hypothetical protein